MPVIRDMILHDNLSSSCVKAPWRSGPGQSTLPGNIHFLQSQPLQSSQAEKNEPNSSSSTAIAGTCIQIEHSN